MSSNDRYNLQKNSDLETLESFKILISNVKSLKDKTWGCPWQKIQSHKSLIPFLNEESSEFIDAIYEKNADNIVVIDKGKIVESGKHEKLLDQNKIYADLWNVQVGI